ncbi:hypothetical protein [Cupriavidus sp. TMH.W2]|uniref:hypothetical protein n=1 Tax=Cupriavidus sp. TMH.W2 TaxID=3434465 RepID=UPI003D77DB7E
MPSEESPVTHPSSFPAAARQPRLRRLALAAGVPVALLCVASVFGMQAGWPAFWHAWRHADAGLAMIALGTLVAGALLALYTGD